MTLKSWFALDAIGRPIKACLPAVMVLLAVLSPRGASADTVTVTFPEYNGPTFSDTAPFPRPIQSVGAFTYQIPAGQEIVSATFHGRFGNSQVNSTAGVNVFLNGVLVGQAFRFDAYWNGILHDFTHEFTPEELTRLAGGVVVMTVQQTSEFNIRLGVSSMTITTRAAGVHLNVPYFNQGDPRWASDFLNDSSRTIQQKGCALSSLAMALNYAGVSTDPGTLNSLLTQEGDFSGLSVSWSDAVSDAADAGGSSVTWHDRRLSSTDPAALTYLRSALDSGNPVVVGVNIDADGAPGHFVLITGYQGTQFIVNDPGHSNVTDLSNYATWETRGFVH